MQQINICSCILLQIVFMVFVQITTCGAIQSESGIASCESLIGDGGICPIGSKCFDQLQVMHRSCANFLGEATECNRACYRALGRILLKFPLIEGALKKCACQKKTYTHYQDRKIDTDYDCITARRRFLRCKSNVKVAPLKSCSQVKKHCLEGNVDPSCGKKYENYFNSCTGLYQDGECTGKCRKAYRELLENPYGKHFRKCTCDGSYDEEKFCLETTELRKTLC